MMRLEAIGTLIENLDLQKEVSKTTEANTSGLLVNSEPEILESRGSCKLCDGLEWVVSMNDRGMSYAVPCVCRQERLHRQRLRRSGLCGALRLITFACYEEWNIDARRAKAKVMEYTGRFSQIRGEVSNSVALLGAVGAGKTMLGVAALNELMEKGVDVMYVKYRDMIAALKNSVNDREVYDAAMRDYLSVEVLFIDDLFKQMSEADIKYVYAVIGGRYASRAPVILTSEMTILDMIAVDEATGSRIAQMCGAHAHTFEQGKVSLNYRLKPTWNVSL
jgi:DNA replication protein DnaC